MTRRDQAVSEPDASSEATAAPPEASVDASSHSDGPTASRADGFGRLDGDSHDHDDDGPDMSALMGPGGMGSFLSKMLGGGEGDLDLSLVKIGDVTVNVYNIEGDLHLHAKSEDDD